ncbi:MAG TPA: FliI/YscN family ATPase [Spirochaetia bacterium]|nr:FliI/YscN family ATPase [Spirochaetia bacterium]
MGVFDKYTARLEDLDPIKYTGIVERVQGLLVESVGPAAKVGELCQILVPRGHGTVWAEVVGLRGKTVQLMPYDEMEGIEVGNIVIGMGEDLRIPVSAKLLGRTLDSMGRPIDAKGDIGSDEWYSAFNAPPDVLRRRRIREIITTGIRSIDGLLTVGKGQRMGIFAGSGIGKSTLLGMIARNTSADVNVIALIGERGREVREFIENDLGPEGLARSVIVVSSSNKPPLARIRGAYVATAIAEYFRDAGKDVMLLFDSVTRFARAQREIGLAIGEPPANRGFTPSVFSILPKLLERSGTSDRGSITGFYTILVEGDDIDDPVSDNVRGILDGHIVLTRKLASRNHYPAVDVLQSISRLANQITGPRTREAAGYIKRMMATHAGAEDLISVGAYVKGSNAEIDEAIEKMPAIDDYLIQRIEERAPLAESLRRAGEIAGIEIPNAELGAAAPAAPVLTEENAAVPVQA